MNSPLTLLKLGVAYIRLARDLNQLERVFVLADELATDESFAPMRAHYKTFEHGRTALREMPRRGTVDLVKLRLLPDGTLGREFARFLDDNKLDPNDLPVRPATDENTFILAHLYETHDIWHVVTGFGSHVAGELGLQAFYLAQSPGRLPPLLLSAGLLNTVGVDHEEATRRLSEVARGFEMGKKAKPLFGIQWNQLWDRKVTDLQAAYGI